MQSNNPVFRRSEEFNRPGTNAYGGAQTETTAGVANDASSLGGDR